MRVIEILNKNIMTKQKLKYAIIVMLGVMGLGIATAQNSANTSGGDASGSGGTVAYSVGQVAYTTNTGASGAISAGVQQTYEISTVVANETVQSISISVFPNPTTDNLTLQISDYIEELWFQLSDLQGKLLDKGQITSKQIQINTSSLSPSSYFISVVNKENKKVQSFKIIKK